jgi:hypothetical protein
MIILERSSCKVTIKAPGQSEDLAKRTPVQVVEAANKAIGSESIIAARRMPSGDTVLTFSRSADLYIGNTTWVEKAFGAEATVKRREFAVIAKGLLATRLREYYDPEEVLKELKKRVPAINRCRIQLLRTLYRRFAEVVLYMNSVAAVQAICRQGVIFKAQIFNVEPYYAAAQVRRCFQCYAFSHIGRYCDRQARCGYYAATAHEGGKACCPEKEPSSTKRCVNCNGRHAVWERSYLVAKAEQEKAQRAYLHRPRQFEVS